MKPLRGGSTDAGTTGDAASASSTARSDRTPGQMLRQERELRGLTLQQAAEELNLDRWILEAIEVDQFLVLGAPVYARGHLRKYAALLGVSQQLVVDRYDSLNETPSVPVVTSTTTVHMPRRSRRERSRGTRTRRRLLIVLVVLGAGAASWWLVRQGLVDSLFNGSARDSSSVVTTPVLNSPNPVEPSAGSQQVGVLAAPLSTTAVGAQSSVSATAKPVNLRLQFTVPAFIEAVDGNGQRLMFETGQAGQVRELRGVAPLDVIVSVASAITMTVNERPMAVPRLPGKEATRFTVNADGSVH